MKKSILPMIIFMLAFAGCLTTNKGHFSGKASAESKVAESVSTPISSKPVNTKQIMYPELSDYIQSVVTGMDAIPQERKDLLKEIAMFVQTKKQSNEPANLTFICTHNSRRSHLSQIWAATAAAHYGIEDAIKTYSGGTEATAFNPRAVAAITRAGFEVVNPGGDNPHYRVTFSENGQVMECFSKKYDDPTNARQNFVAVMTCSEADQNCPYIPGASLRVPVPYIDPKEADGTDHEAATYDERCKQIATEMFYMMSLVKV